MEKILKIKKHDDIAEKKRKGSVMPETGEKLIGEYIAKETTPINGKNVTYNVWRFWIVRKGCIIKSHVPVGRFNRVFITEVDNEQREYSFNGSFVDAYLSSDDNTQQSIARCVINLDTVDKVKIGDNNYWFATLDAVGYWEDADTLLSLIGEDLFEKVAPILFDEVEGSDIIKVVKTDTENVQVIEGGEGEGEGKTE